MAESIRRMVGASSGLWGMAFGSGSYEAPKASDVLKEAPVPDGVINALDRVAEWKGTTSLPSSAPDTAILSEWLQPSLATEGMLWFPNLMVPDPLMILPFAVSGLTIASLYAGSRAPNKTKEKPAHTILKRVMMTFALAIGPLTLNMPAGILLYWSASTVCAFLTHVLLDMFRPIRMPPKPCKRTIPYSPRRKVVGAVKMARR
ncbi:putative membrane insertion protein [Diplodia seriata]|uniref:Putative membrane insertion protein n=1 Tax=Diplodia seriata TaxID=420778 RepID=A0A0G2H3Q9_9PEZI|nr:putative membrane insertion protein [Diplodia seriata]